MGPSWNQFSSTSCRQLTKIFSHCSIRPRTRQSPQTQQLCLQTQILLRVGTSAQSLGTQET